MLKEAWKADLNFIPSHKDRLLPHQIIEEELKKELTEENEKKLKSFDSINEINEFTFFQLTTFPFLDSDIELKKQKVESMIEKLKTE